MLLPTQLIAKIVTENVNEQAAIEAVLKDAGLEWEDITFSQNIIISDKKKEGHTLVYKKGRNKLWEIGAIGKYKFYLNPEGKVIAINLSSTNFKTAKLIEKFKSLVFFRCDNCREIIFEELSDLPELEDLNVGSSLLKKIPKLSSLNKLRFLKLVNLISTLQISC